MKKAIILHNPSAGEENQTKNSLITAAKANGYHALYHKAKKAKKWKKKLDQVDYILSAGGDGTVRRIVKELVKRTLLDNQLTLNILPMGTANNLWKAVQIKRQASEKTNQITNLDNKTQDFDLGKLSIKGKTDFFLESAGFGLIPLLIEVMDKTDIKHLKSTEDELVYSLKALYQLILNIPAQEYRIQTKKSNFKIKAILLEVVNSPYIGPNLNIAPQANFSDGLLDIVVITEDQRLDFANYIENLIEGGTPSFNPQLMQLRKVEISTKDKKLHIDDELISTNQKNFKFTLLEKVIKIL